MKTKQLILPIALVTVAMVFQACPIPGPSPDYVDTSHTKEYRAHAYIFTPEDSISVMWYDVNHRVNYDTLLPSPYLQEAHWISTESMFYHMLKDEKYSEKYNTLHLKKLSNKATATVIEGHRLYVNNELVRYEDWRDPADTITVSNILMEEQILSHPYVTPPCSLETLLQELRKQYPEILSNMEDCEWHTFEQSYLMVPDNFPHVTIKL